MSPPTQSTGTFFIVDVETFDAFAAQQHPTSLGVFLLVDASEEPGGDCYRIYPQSQDAVRYLAGWLAGRFTANRSAGQAVDAARTAVYRSHADG